MKLTNTVELEQMGIAPRYHFSTFSDFKGTEVVRKQVMKYASLVKINAARGRGVFIFGLNGSNASLLAACLAKSALASELKVKVVDIDDIVAAYFKRGENDEWNQIRRTQYLVIDGICGSSTLASGLRVNEGMKLAFHSLLVFRHKFLTPTVFVSSITMSEIDEFYGEDVHYLINSSTLKIAVATESQERENKKSKKRLSKVYGAR